MKTLFVVGWTLNVCGLFALAVGLPKLSFPLFVAATVVFGYGLYKSLTSHR
jgi:small basic protein